MTRVRATMMDLVWAMLLGASLALLMPQARAEVIATDEAQAGGIEQERERLKAALDRPEVARELEKFGITAKDAKGRVGAMTDMEVRTLAGRIDALPAGGALNNTELLMIILLVVILVLLL
jgi:hypothetical protein